MKLEAGKFYKTRDGHKAYIAGKHFDSTIPYPIVGWIENEDCPQTWKPDGVFTLSGNAEYDLVAEWREPETRTIDIVLVRWRNTGGVWAGMHCYLPVGECDILARKTFTITEGEGLEDVK